MSSPTASPPGPPTYAELEPLKDDQLMACLQKGYNDALAVLFDRYHRLVFSIALRIVHDHGEAEDVMQNVFLEIFRSAVHFDPAKGTTRIWLLQYAYHRAINRKEHLNLRGHYSHISTEDSEVVTPGGTTTLGGYTPNELKHLIQQALATLSKPQKRVIELASYDGLSMKEIADKTGESLANVRHYYYRGLRKLRSFVERPSAMRKAAGSE